MLIIEINKLFIIKEFKQFNKLKILIDNTFLHFETKLI